MPVPRRTSHTLPPPVSTPFPPHSQKAHLIRPPPPPTHTPTVDPTPANHWQTMFPRPLCTPANAMTAQPAATPGPQPTPAPASEEVPSRPYPEPYPQLTHLNGDPTKHGSWSLRWRTFLEIARTFTLNDLLFDHGFPTTFVLKNKAGESLTHAWTVYHFNHKGEPLCGILCKPFCFSCPTNAF